MPKANTAAQVSAQREGHHAIQTGEDSSAIVSMQDMSTFTMKAEYEVVLTPPPESKGPMDRAMDILITNIKRMLKDGSMEIETTQCACSIKG